MIDDFILTARLCLVGRFFNFLIFIFFIFYFGSNVEEWWELQSVLVSGNDSICLALYCLSFVFLSVLCIIRSAHSSRKVVFFFLDYPIEPTI